MTNSSEEELTSLALNVEEARPRRFEIQQEQMGNIRETGSLRKAQGNARNTEAEMKNAFIGSSAWLRKGSVNWRICQYFTLQKLKRKEKREKSGKEYAKTVGQLQNMSEA